MRINIDSGWRFYKGDLAPKTPADSWGGAKAGAYNFGAVNAALDDSKWRILDLPHDFVAEGDYTRSSGDSGMGDIPEMESIDSRHVAGGSLAGGVAWYRKTFDAPGDKRVMLHFGGVYRCCDVYLNQNYIGHHESGYSSFCFDVTDFINNNGKNNVLAVRVDATGREGWWYEGGGIYRHVWLEVTENIRFAPSGVFVMPSVNLEDKKADIRVKVEISNKNTEAAAVTIKTVVTDADGCKVAECETAADCTAWDKTLAELAFGFNDAHLWDIDDPYLYTLTTELYSGDKLLDTNKTAFGVRETRFDADKGFFLNGRPLKIKGVCCHHDHAGVGIGIPDSVWEYRIAQLKSMGANAYRGAHGQIADEVLDICDRMGMLVFAETRRMSSCEEDLECLREVVRHGRNHPSVFLWGIGNEEIFVQHKPETKKVMLTMRAELRRLDPTRPVTAAVVCWDGVKRYEHARMFIGITDKTLDVMGFNYCRTAWDDYHERVPQQPVIVTEEASNAWTRGVYSTDEPSGRYYIFDPDNEEKCSSGKKAVKRDTAELSWKKVAESDYISGTFIWTGIDYRGEPTPLSYPCVYSHFGLMDYCAFPKDSYFYFKSWWQDEPVLHIFPHWSMDNEGERLPVYCYSNADEVELFVNGKSYGKKAMERNWYIEWPDVVYAPGELKAVAYKDGREIMTRIVRTTGAAAAINAEPYRDSITIGDTAVINIRICDSNGEIVQTADNRLSFEIEGGELAGTGNGDPADHDSEKLPYRRAFMGRCQLLVRAREKGTVKVKITSPSLEAAECTIEVNDI